MQANRGFTLVELMVTVAVLAIISSIAFPNMRELIVNGRITTQTNELISSLSLARSEAIKRGRTVVLCRTDDPLAASPACASGSDWAGGWVMRQGDQPIRVQPAYANSGGIVATGIATLQFLPTGSVVGVGGSFTFRPRLAESDEAYARLSRRICLNAQGVTRDC